MKHYFAYTENVLLYWYINRTYLLFPSLLLREEKKKKKKDYIKYIYIYMDSKHCTSSVAFLLFYYQKIQLRVMVQLLLSHFSAGES